MKSSKPELEKIVAETGDKKASVRHTAKYLLVAHTRYTNESGETVRLGQLIVARCFTRNEARKFMKDIKSADTFKFAGVADGSPVYEEAKGPARKIMAILADGTKLTEHIDKFSIVEKTNHEMFIQ